MLCYRLALILFIFCLSVLKLFAQEHPHKVLTSPCEACHIPASFKEIRFDHNSTQYLLEGLHQGATCTECHAIEDFSKAEQNCATCHQDVHQAKLGNDCARCHAPTGWVQFDAEGIHSQTRFPLLGRHIFVDCQSCHRGLPQNDFALNTTTCESCHQQQFLDTQSPNHVSFGFSTDCQECHQMNAWQPAFLPDHDALFFPIFSGEHRGKWDDCSTCHPEINNRNVFSCLTCHEHNQNKMDSEHQGIPGYAYNSQDCLMCHPTGDEGEFRSHDTQFFPIFSGEHNNKWDDCKSCHANPDNRKEFSCVTCHEHAQDKMDPEHSGISGYVFNSINCFQCHPTGEKDEFRDHDALFFPIFSGTHNSNWDDCQSCHIEPNNRKAYSCVTCHEHAQGEMDPKHNGITGYVFNSPDCYQCHPTGEKSDFTDHDPQFFPIFSGTHNNNWDDCKSCHIEPNNRKAFSCVTCHEHAQGEMDPKHNGITGYVFNSPDCYQCHPTGEKGDFTDHDPQFFPIFSGAHNNKWDDCKTCHTDPNNRKVFSCVTCHEHAQGEMDPKHSGIPGYAFDSANCYQCHPTGVKGEFRDHDALYFPIFSGPHNNKWDSCATCHNVPGNNKIFTCLDCHEHSQLKMDDKHLGEVQNYRYESAACYECHPNGKEDDDND